MGETSTDLNTITYADTVTPTISKIEPRYGKVNGNEAVTFTGTNFIDGKTTVKIDGIVCTPTSVSTTSVTCTTGSKPNEEGDPSVEVLVEDRGLATTGGKIFRYVSYWSEASTWGNDAPPQYGEAVSIPKGRNLLVDSKMVPQLSFVLVEGSLIFAPDADANHHRTFDCGYIFLKGGYMEVGTEEYPYTSKITITMHGTVSDPALPTYGNKSIGVRNGELHMVGKERKVTWTELDKTANVGDTTVTLVSQTNGDFDWVTGEEIIIASTSFDHNESEKMTIQSVADDGTDATKKVLTLTSALKYKHYAATETYGSDTIDMRAEVGLLTRNVKFQGDPETSAEN